jgi:universal stress protein E
MPPEHRHLVGRHPTDAIVEVARETGSGIVVMGAMSRSGLRRLVIGNTAERVLDQLACDVLIVKPKQFRCRITRAVRGPQLVAPPPPGF